MPEFIDLDAIANEDLIQRLITLKGHGPLDSRNDNDVYLGENGYTICR